MDTTENTLSSSPVSSGIKMFIFSPEENQLSFKTTDKNITVRCSGGAHDRGSSKIKLIDVVSYKWEVKHYPGRLIACHKECKLFAYAITVTKLSKSEGMVRVAQTAQVAERGIIRGLSNEVLDIQFAHTSSPDYLLGIIERTTLQVHQVFVKGTKVTTALKVKIVDPLDGHVPVCDRINWCPYLLENDYEIDDFASQLLVWTRGSTFQCYSISTLTKTYADTSDLKASDIDEGGFKASDGDATITGSVFSADGTTLALSSTDGMIRFYQVYQYSNDCTPRRLHQWKPHGGRPVSSFFFLDNYTEAVGDKVLWKHAITCADNNTEIRVWCCESWECLQTVRLESPLSQSLNFKAEIDLSSTYLVLSDMNTRQVYVLQIRKGQSGRSGLPSPSSSSRDPDQVQDEPQWKSRTASLARGKVIRRAEQSSIKPHIVSIAEYPISKMVLGLSIIYARVGNYMLREQDDDDEDQSLPSCIVIRMFLVQSGVIQDCTLVYDPVDENECDVLAIAEGDVGPIDCEVDGNDTQTSQSSSSSTSTSTETTDNNLSHPPSEASDQSIERKTKAELNASAGAPKATAEESSDGSASGSNSNNDEEEDESTSATSNLLKLKMAEAAQKLNEAMSPVTADTSTNVTVGTSGPTTPAGTAKVNLMTPESFSTPSGRGSRSAKDGSVPPQKDVRIINLSELPYPAVETIMSQLDRRRSRGRGRGATGGSNTATVGGSRQNNSSVTSTASANGSVDSSDGGSTSEEEGGAGGNNTSVASIAGSERVANITDDPDDDDDDDDDGNRDEDEAEKKDRREAGAVVASAGVAGDPAEVVTAKGKEKHARAGLANGSPGSAEQTKKKGHGGGMLTVSGTVLNVEHFTKILTLDEAEPPTGREKNKADETVNPNVLSTLFMLAQATKQQQQLVSSSGALTAATVQPAQPPPQPPTVASLQAFVNMVQSRAANEEANSGKTQASGKLRKSINGPMEGPEGAAASVSAVPPEIPPMPSAEMLASGGSSPSREVQEIMSTKGPGINMLVDDLFQFMCTPGQRKDVYDDEEEEEEEEEEDEEAEEVEVEMDVQSLSVVEQSTTSNINQFDEEDGVVQVTTNGPPPPPPEDTPQADEADGTEKVVEDGKAIVVEAAAGSEKTASAEADAGTQRKKDQANVAIGVLDAKEVTEGGGVGGGVVESKDTASAPFWPSKVPTELLPEKGPLEVKNSLKRSSMPPTVAGGGSMASSMSGVPPAVVVDSSKQLEALTSKLDCMMELLVAQSRKIEDMNGQLETLKKAKSEDHRRYSALVNRFQQTIPKMIETQINSCFGQNSAKLEQSLLVSLSTRQAQLLDALKLTLSQALMAQLPERVSALVMRDLHQKLLPPIGSKLDVIQRSLSLDVALKVRNIEVSVQDVIHRTVQSEQFISKFAKHLLCGVLVDIRKVVEKSFEDSLRDLVLPSYESSTQELFRQIKICFSGGLQDFMRKIDDHIARVADTQVRANELVDILRILPDKITASGERSTANTVRMIREHLEKDMKVLQTPLLKTIREHIRQEIEKGFEAQASSLEDSVLSVVRSQAQTPAPSNMDVQEQIKQYLNAGQINKAFHKALLSNDLSLVEFLLERADHKQVFNPCPLEQTVLLSLIQQISADMSNHNELKHKYLADAIVNLDFHDPITKEHSPKVMLELLNNCQAFMAANPTSSLCTNLKMVIIAIQYMGVKQF